MQKIEKKFTIAGKEVTLTTGNFGFRADVALMAQQGETVVMVFVTVDSKDTHLDYFPLGINYMEKFYAGGIISGSRFIKREKRPSEDATIRGRIIDRGMRPMFPTDFKRGVSVVINVMAYDGENDPAMLGANAASMAVHMSSIPYDGPVGFVRVGKDEEGNLVADPSKPLMKEMDLDAVIAATPTTITQLEVDGKIISNDEMKKAFDLAFETAQDWNKAAEEMRSEQGRDKIEISESKVDPELVELMNKEYLPAIEDAIYDDENRNVKLDSLYNKAVEEHADEEAEDGYTGGDIVNAIKYVEKKIVREGLLEGKRPSGRKLDEIRELEIEDQFLPRVHGSAMFRRGTTQALGITTLASSRLAQLEESFEGESKKRYMHHYVGPNYSFGAAGRFNFYAGNREIGHGMLAEKAVLPVLPSEEDFPYTIRVVSEILSQNGSTSMAATCASCLALMDAGVPISAPVAGISVGLITKDAEQTDYELLTDVQDVEDFYGDMDFKVCGTAEGITAIQMDTKLKGVNPEILKDALDRGEEARLVILEKYKEVFDGPRADLSQYAPRVETIRIKEDQIGDLIGPGGKVIKGILEEIDNQADIDIQDDGRVLVTAVDGAVMQQVIDLIGEVTLSLEVDQIYEGKVFRIEAYGAFVQVGPNATGLVHVSELADGFVKNVEEYVKLGQVVKVKVIGKESDGKVKLSIKQNGEKKEPVGEKKTETNS